MTVPEQMDLIIVSGGTRGIGKKIVDESTNIAKQLVVLGRNAETRADTQKNTRNYPVDIKQLDQVERIVSSEVKQLRPKNVGIALCAATLGHPGGLIKNELEKWADDYKTNVLGNLQVVRSAAQHLDSSAKLRVIFFAGGGAAYGYPEFFSYSLTKVAIVRAAENLGSELSSVIANSSIIALAPGAVDTDMLKAVVANGGSVKTKTDISEPANFVQKFFLDELPVKKMNGRFIHVRDDLSKLENKDDPGSLFALRRIE